MPISAQHIAGCCHQAQRCHQPRLSPSGIHHLSSCSAHTDCCASHQPNHRHRYCGPSPWRHLHQLHLHRGAPQRRAAHHSDQHQPYGCHPRLDAWHAGTLIDSPCRVMHAIHRYSATCWHAGPGRCVMSNKCCLHPTAVPVVQYQVTVVGTLPNGQKSPPSAADIMTTPLAGCAALLQALIDVMQAELHDATHSSAPPSITCPHSFDNEHRCCAERPSPPQRCQTAPPPPT